MPTAALRLAVFTACQSMVIVDPAFRRALAAIDVRGCDRPTEGWGLLLQRLPSGGTVYLNGRMVADVPTDTDTQRSALAATAPINLPTDFLKSGSNEVLIHTSYGSGVHGLGRAQVGPTAELQPLYSREFFVSHTLRWISLGPDRAARGGLRGAVVPAPQRATCSACSP